MTALEKGLCMARWFLDSIIVVVLLMAAIAVVLYFIAQDCPCSYCDMWMCLRASFGMH